MSVKEFNIELKSDSKFVNRKDLLLAFASGLMLGLAFPPLPFYPLLFVAFIPLFKVLERRNSLAEINRITYFSMFIYNIITLYWVGSWQPDTDSFLMVAGVALLFFNPIVFLIPTTIYYWTYKKFGRKIGLYLFPLFWVTAEFLYGISDFRFPWVTLGHSLSYFNSFIQIADIIGSFGLGILVIYINIFFFITYKNFIELRNHFIPLFLGVGLIALALIYGGIKINTLPRANSKLKIGVVQPNLNPWKKWEAGNLDQQLDLYLELSIKEVKNGAELIVWPETALPVYLLAGGYERIVEDIHKFCDTNNVYLLTGMPHANFYFDSTEAPREAKKTNSGTYYTSYNSIVLFQPGNREIPKYGKIKLVPFGEKVPLVEHIPFLGDIIKWNVGISSWNEGKEQKVFEVKQDNKSFNVAGVVCIESIYPRFINGFVDNGAELLIVVTNDSWYGDSSGPYQHKEMSVLRAIETRRSVVRSANGGISCVIDKLGNTKISTEMYTRTSFTFDVEINNEKTIYSSTAYVLPLLSLLVSIFVMFAFTFDKIKKKKK